MCSSWAIHWATLQSRMPTCDILQESLRLLKPRGWLLLDVTDGAAACTTLAPLAWHEIGDDVVVCRQREVSDGRICAREMVLSKAHGMIRDRTYCIRPYAAEDLSALVARAGFGRRRAITAMRRP